VEIASAPRNAFALVATAAAALLRLFVLRVLHRHASLRIIGFVPEEELQTM
jgi:hypothetical protein